MTLSANVDQMRSLDISMLCMESLFLNFVPPRDMRVDAPTGVTDQPPNIDDEDDYDATENTEEDAFLYEDEKRIVQNLAEVQVIEETIVHATTERSRLDTSTVCTTGSIFHTKLFLPQMCLALIYHLMLLKCLSLQLYHVLMPKMMTSLEIHRTRLFIGISCQGPFTHFPHILISIELRTVLVTFYEASVFMPIFFIVCCCLFFILDILIV